MDFPDELPSSLFDGFIDKLEADFQADMEAEKEAMENIYASVTPKSLGSPLQTTALEDFLDSSVESSPAKESDNVVSPSKENVAPKEFNMKALTLQVQDLHKNVTKSQSNSNTFIEDLQSERDHLIQRLQQSEKLWNVERQHLEKNALQERQELTELFQEQLARVEAEKDQAVVQATTAARVAGLASFLFLQQEYNAIEEELFDTLEDLDEAQEENKLLVDSLHVLTQANAKMQLDYDDLEKELFEAIDDMEDLQYERQEDMERMKALEQKLLALETEQVESHSQLRQVQEIQREDSLHQQVDLFRYLSKQFEAKTDQEHAAATDNSETAATAAEIRSQIGGEGDQDRNSKINENQQSPLKILTTVLQETVVSPTGKADLLPDGKPKECNSSPNGAGTKNKVMSSTPQFKPMTGPSEQRDLPPTVTAKMVAPTPKRPQATNTTMPSPRPSSSKVAPSPGSAFSSIKSETKVTNSPGFKHAIDLVSTPKSAAKHMGKSESRKLTKKSGAEKENNAKTPKRSVSKKERVSMIPKSGLKAPQRRSNLFAPTASSRARKTDRTARPSRPLQRPVDTKRPASKVASLASNRTKSRRLNEIHTSTSGDGKVPSATKNTRSRPSRIQPVGKPRSRLPTFGGQKKVTAPLASSAAPMSALRSRGGGIKTPSAAKATSGVSFQRMATKTPQTSGTSTKKKTSPKDIIRAYVATHSEAKTPQKKPEVVIPSTPSETIDETPKEATPTNVTEKFESLFNVWSTAKKSRKPGEYLTLGTPLPAKLELQWASTIKKTRRVAPREFRTCPRKRARNGGTPEAPRTSIKRLQESTTPFALSTIAGVASPGELLVSPPLRSQTAQLSQVSSPSAQSVVLSPKTPLVTTVTSPSLNKEVNMCNIEQVSSPLLVPLSESTVVALNEKMPAVTSPVVESTTLKPCLSSTAMVESSTALAPVNDIVVNTSDCSAQTTQSLGSVTNTEVSHSSPVAKASVMASSSEILDLSSSATPATVETKKLADEKSSSEQAETIVQKQLEGATKIQAVARRLFARSQIKHSVAAIIKLQSRARGFTSRSKVAWMRKSIVQVQSLWRQRSQEKKYKKTLSSTLIIQSLARQLVICRRLQLRQTSSIAIQTKWRSVYMQKCFNAKQKVAIQLQAQVRRILSTKIVLMLRQALAATKIQAAWRSNQCQCLRRRNLTGIVFIQALYRGFRCRAYIRIRDTATTSIQAMWRCQLARKKYTHHYKAAIKIQACIRSSLQHQAFMNCIGQVIKIQSVARTFVCRQRCGYLRREATQAATLIQTKWRSVNAQRKFSCSVSSIVLLQALFRRHLSEKTLVKIRLTSKSAVQIQSFARMAISRKQYQVVLCKTAAATTIQSSWRRSTTRKELQALQSSVITLQTVFRRHLATNKVNKKLAARKKAEENRLSLSKPSRAPLGLISDPQKSRKKQINKNIVVESVFSPLHTRRRGNASSKLGANPGIVRDKENNAVFVAQDKVVKSSATLLDKQTDNNDSELLPIGSMRVVDLREELTRDFGMVPKDIRKLRKAQLADLLTDKRVALGLRCD